jgi:UDP-glucose 4-epimerase
MTGKALIVGGAGFVGRNLARRLTQQGLKVTVLDRHADASKSFLGETLIADARQPGVLLDALDHTDPDVVYHLAANSDISAGVADASLDFGDTLMTTVAQRQALTRHPVDQLVFASSSAIYGVVNAPLGEAIDGFAEPVSWYGRAKLASEYMLESLAVAAPAMSILIVRFPNVVGPLATHGVVFDFVNRLRCEPTVLAVLGDGYQAKPYVHVYELLGGIEYFRERLEPGVTRVNLGPTDTVSVRGIVEEVTTVLGLDPKVTYQDSPYGWPGDVPRYEFDTSNMRRRGFSIDTTSRAAVRRAAEDLADEIYAR